MQVFNINCLRSFIQRLILRICKLELIFSLYDLLYQAYLVFYFKIILQESLNEPQRLPIFVFAIPSSCSALPLSLLRRPNDDVKLQNN